MSIDATALREKLSFKSLIKIGLALLFLFISLSNGAGYFPESRYLFFGSLAILAGLWLFNEGFLIQKIDLLLLTFLFIAVLSTGTLVNLHVSLDALFLLLSYIFFFWMVKENLNSKSEINFVLVLIVTVATILSVYGLYQYLIGFNVLAKYAAEKSILINTQSRVFATFISPNVLAGFLMLAIPLNIFLLFYETITWRKILLFISGAIVGCCFLLTYSRGGYIALFTVILATVILMSKERKKKLFLIFIILALLVFSSYAVVQRLRSPSTASYKGITTPSAAQTSFGGRTLLWRGSLNVAKNYPLLGSGFGTFSSIYPKYQYGGLFSRHAHNTYLEILAETGFLGFLLFLCILFVVARQQFRIAAKAKDVYFKDLGIILFAATVGFLVHNFVDFDWHIPIIGVTFWVLAGIAFAIKKIDDGGEHFFPSNNKKFILIRRVGAVFVIFLGVTTIVGPYRAAVFAEKASDLLKNGEKNKAMLCLSKAVELDPLSALYRFRLADISLNKEQKNISYVQKLNERAVALEPFNANYRAALAGIYLREGKTKEAQREYEKAKEFYPLDPHYPLQLGQFYVLQGENNKAMKEFKEAISLRSYYYIWYTEKPIEAITNAHLQLGNLYVKNNKFDEAIGEYKEALRLKPDSGAAYYNLACVYQSKKMRDEAITNYKKAIEIKPDYSLAHYYLGILYEEIGETELAVIQFEEALRLEPENIFYKEKLYESEGGLNE